MPVGFNNLRLLPQLSEEDVVMEEELASASSAPSVSNFNTPGATLIDLLKGEFYALMYSFSDPADQSRLRNLNIWKPLRYAVSMLEKEDFRLVAVTDECDRIDLEASHYSLNTDVGLEGLSQLISRSGGRTIKLLVFSAGDESISTNHPQVATLSGVRKLARGMWELDFSNIQRVTDFVESGSDKICLAGGGSLKTIINTSEGAPKNSALNFDKAFAFVYSGDDNDPGGGEPIPKPEVLMVVQPVMAAFAA